MPPFCPQKNDAVGDITVLTDGRSSPRGASCPPLGRTTWHYFVDNIELLRSSIAQTTPDPSGRRTPSRRRLVTKFGSVPTSSSPRTFWWRNIAALATGRRCSRPFLTVFRENLNKPADRETAATTPPRLCRRAPGRLTQPPGTRGRPLTEFGQPPPASSLAAPGTPATSPASCCVARFWAVSPQKRPPPVPFRTFSGHETP